jgi:cytochrome c oxidase subunit 2
MDKTRRQMNDLPPTKKRILIASRHPLFGKGIQSLLADRWGNLLEVIGIVEDIEGAAIALKEWSPNLLIVDYDDVTLNRDEFLTMFIESQKELRVVLLSLKEGLEGSKAIVYDRRTMVASQIDTWLEQGMSFQEGSRTRKRGDAS